MCVCASRGNTWWVQAAHLEVTKEMIVYVCVRVSDEWWGDIVKVCAMLWHIAYDSLWFHCDQTARELSTTHTHPQRHTIHTHIQTPLSLLAALDISQLSPPLTLPRRTQTHTVQTHKKTHMELTPMQACARAYTSTCVKVCTYSDRHLQLDACVGDVDLWLVCFQCVHVFVCSTVHFLIINVSYSRLSPLFLLGAITHNWSKGT